VFFDEQPRYQAATRDEILDAVRDRGDLLPRAR
jgi:hypothetical protein